MSRSVSRYVRGSKKMAAVSAVAVGAVLVLGACSSSDSSLTSSTSPTTAASSASTSKAPSSSSTTQATTTGTVVNPSDGTTVSVKVGGTVTIALPANPSTGYAWTVGTPPDSSLVSVVGTDFKAGGSSAPGSGGTFTMDLKGVKAGKTSISLVYAKSSAPTDNPTNLTLPIVVS